MKIIGIIPAHLASVRFPNKILHPFHGLPMIEHVRRRASLCSALDAVCVATCDQAIAKAIQTHGGQVIMTSKQHPNGTSRVAEAAQALDCSHVLLLQGDEPLVLPQHLHAVIEAMQQYPDADAWNAVGPIESETELDRHSFVKCAVGTNNQVLLCFRRSPAFSALALQQRFIHKILGIMAYQTAFLKILSELPPTPIEQAEWIEQMRIIEHGYKLQAVPVSPSLPSVNEPHETALIDEQLARNSVQAQLLERILAPQWEETTE